MTKNSDVVDTWDRIPNKARANNPLYPAPPSTTTTTATIRERKGSEEESEEEEGEEGGEGGGVKGRMEGSITSNSNKFSGLETKYVPSPLSHTGQRENEFLEEVEKIE